MHDQRVALRELIAAREASRETTRRLETWERLDAIKIDAVNRLAKRILDDHLGSARDVRGRKFFATDWLVPSSDDTVNGKDTGAICRAFIGGYRSHIEL